MRRSPSIDMSRGRSAKPMSLARQGRRHQLEVSSTMCSCIRVMPMAVTGIGPSTVITCPERTPVGGVIVLMVALLMSISRSGGPP